MKRKTIDSMREVRLWAGQILLPAAALVMAISPELRTSAAEKLNKAKDCIGQKFKKGS